MSSPAAAEIVRHGVEAATAATKADAAGNAEVAAALYIKAAAILRKLLAQEASQSDTAMVRISRDTLSPVRWYQPTTTAGAPLLSRRSLLPRLLSTLTERRCWLARGQRPAADSLALPRAPQPRARQQWP